VTFQLGGIRVEIGDESGHALRRAPDRMPRGAAIMAIPRAAAAIRCRGTGDAPKAQLGRRSAVRVEVLVDGACRLQQRR
jgi:hypothetical protein